MGPLHSNPNFPKCHRINFYSHLSLRWDILYFSDSLAASKVRKFAENFLRSPHRGPGGSTRIDCEAGVRIIITDRSAFALGRPEDGSDSILPRAGLPYGAVRERHGILLAKFRVPSFNAN